MLNEELAYAKCARFAAFARMDSGRSSDYKTADADRMDHFRKGFDLAMLCSNDTANLNAAIQDKASQIDMYSDS